MFGILSLILTRGGGKMKTNTLIKRWLWLVTFVTLGILILVGMSHIGVSEAADEKAILIGISQDMTGYNADLGRAERDGIIMAIEEWNEKGGVRGRKIEYTVRDNGADPIKATSIAKEFVAKGIFAFMGGTSSTVGIPENKVMAENQTLSLGGAGAVANFIKSSDGKWWYFNLCTAVPEQALVPLVFFSNKGYKKLAYIISGAAWPKTYDIATER
jgi:ABC-type branched-subunit amino acid transport system substrate-binding protein